MKSSPPPPVEDPAAVAARTAEQARAEASRVAATQANLDAATLARLRRFGRIQQLGSAGGVPIIAPTFGGIGFGGVGGVGGGGGGGAAGGGGGGGSFRSGAGGGSFHIEQY